MDIDTLRKIASAAREKSGVVTAQTIRQEAIDGSLAAELMAEQATTLSRLGQGMDEALAVLARLQQQAKLPGADREALLAEDKEARARFHRLRWEMLVVREAMGLSGVRAEIDRCWPIPPHLP